MIAIRFDGPPSHESGRFIEVERDGASISFGEWKQDGDDWLLELPEVALLEDVVEAAKELRNVLPSSSFWQVKDHDKTWIWCWEELSDEAQQRVKQAGIRFGKALAKLETKSMLNVPPDPSR